MLEALMAVVWITCPTTGHRYSTGIETDADSLAMIPAWTATYQCKSCDATHLWADVQPELVAEPPPIIQ